MDSGPAPGMNYTPPRVKLAGLLGPPRVVRQDPLEQNGVKNSAGPNLAHMPKATGASSAPWLIIGRAISARSVKGVRGRPSP